MDGLLCSSNHSLRDQVLWRFIDLDQRQQLPYCGRQADATRACPTFDPPAVRRPLHRNGSEAKLVHGLRQELTEEERYRVADDVVHRLKQHGDPWRLFPKNDS
jgi:hypothetical protein